MNTCAAKGLSHLPMMSTPYWVAHRLWIKLILKAAYVKGTTARKPRRVRASNSCVEAARDRRDTAYARVRGARR